MPHTPNQYLCMLLPILGCVVLSPRAAIPTRLESPDRPVRMHETVLQRPDLMVKKDSEPESMYAINNDYQSVPSGRQVKSAQVIPNATARFQVKVENDGRGVNTYVLRAAENASAGWTVTYRMGNTDVTARITGSEGYQTSRLAEQASEIFTIEMTAGGVAGLCPKTITLRVFHNERDTICRDVVQVTSSVIPDITAGVHVAPNPGAYDGVLTFSITVTRTAFTGSFRVDFFRRLPGPPTSGDIGDNVFQINPGTETISRTVTFRTTSCGSFAAYVKVDGPNQVAETNENNNVASVAYTVAPLTISGTVADTAGRRLGDVMITASTSLTDTVWQTNTDTNGRYRLSYLLPGPYLVKARKEKYVFEPAGGRVASVTSGAPHAPNVDFTGIGIDLSVSLTITPNPATAGAQLTAKLVVSRSAATKSFWVDLYTDRVTPPGLKQQGNHFFVVPAGDSRVTRTITFRSPPTGTFRAWAQVDTDGTVDEVNEANNVTGPVIYTVTGITTAGQCILNESCDFKNIVQ